MDHELEDREFDMLGGTYFYTALTWLGRPGRKEYASYYPNDQIQAELPRFDE